MKKIAGIGLLFLLVGIFAGILTEHFNTPHIHRSPLSTQKSFYDNIFASTRIENISLVPDIKGAIANHHLLAPELIIRALSTASQSHKNPETIVLISPNHFSRGRNNIVLSEYDWMTPYGTIEADKNLARRLSKGKFADIDETPFEYEHGIANITPFIKNIFPDARLLPVIVKDSLSPQQEEDFISALIENIPKNSLLILSADMSHYTSSAGADFHDEKTMAVINNFDYESTKFLDIDSQAGLRIFLKAMERLGAQKWTMLDHNNSAKIIQDYPLEGTTSYITGVFSAGRPKYVQTATILALGDLMLDRGVKKTIGTNGVYSPFEKIRRFLGGSDIVVANLEGPFTKFPSQNPQGQKISLAFDPGMVPILANLGFTHLNLANNHTLDSGKDGFVETQKFLEQNNIDYFGDPPNKETLSTVKTIRGLKIAFIGFHQFSYTGLEHVVSEIQRFEKEADFTVLYAHWGAEYSSSLSRYQISAAHAFIDAGADIIIGTHPHVIQPMETYKNRAIFYSLGNFLFDQDFSKDTVENIGIGVTITPREVQLYVFPLIMKEYQVMLVEGREGDILLKNKGFSERIVLPYE